MTLFLTGFFFVTCCNNKPTAGYLWFWYAVPFKRKLSLRSRSGIIGLLPTREAVDWVSRFGKCLLTQQKKIQVETERYSSLGGGSGGLLVDHLKK